MFKSRAVNIVDYRSIKIPNNLIEIPTTEISAAIFKVEKKYAHYEKVQSIMVGDLVTMDLESSIEKYNKQSLPVVVGLGLFNKSFEEQILSLNIFETAIISLNDSKIKTTITNIERKVINPVTDEMIKAENIDGVLTVDEYKKYIYDEVVSNALTEISEFVLSEVLNSSEFKLLEEDFNSLFENELVKLRKFAELENMVLEKMTEQELGMRIGQPSLQSFEEILRMNWYPLILKEYLISMSIAKEEKIEFNENSYEIFMDSKINQNNYSMKDAKALNPYLQYLIHSYRNYACEKIKDYYRGIINRKNSLLN